jgi:hypothetical protein
MQKIDIVELSGAEIALVSGGRKIVREGTTGILGRKIVREGTTGILGRKIVREGTTGILG